MEIILKYFPDLSEAQLRQISDLHMLYTHWNKRINVISRKDIQNLNEHHILHSLAIAKLISFKPASTILDAGTGGGLPGIPLAILFPESDFHLVDSVGKKIKVVRAIKEKLGLQNVTPVQSRIEDIEGLYDFVVCRAVTSFSEMAKWVAGKIHKENRNSLSNGILYLKGGDLDEELKEYEEGTHILMIKDYFEEPYFETKKILYLPAVSDTY